MLPPVSLILTLFSRGSALLLTYEAHPEDTPMNHS